MNKTNLSLHRLPAHTLTHRLFLFAFQKLPLLVGIHTPHLAVSLFLFLLVGVEFALVGLFEFELLFDLLGLVVAGGADAAHDFGTEVAGRDEVVGQAEEGLDEGEIGGRGWVLETEVELEALLWDEVVEAVKSVKRVWG